MLDGSIIAREMLRLRRMAVTFGICSAVSSAWPLYAAYIAARLGHLTSQYGWGHIPPHELPFIIYHPVDFGAYAAISLVRLAAAAAFLRGAASIHRIFVAIGSAPDLRWSWRWTLFSCFIPLVNLIRPWLGLQELYRRALQLAARDRSPRRFFAWMMAAMIAITGLVFVMNQIIFDGIARDISTNVDPASHYIAFSGWLVFEAILIAATAWVMFGYLERIRRALLVVTSARQVDVFS